MIYESACWTKLTILCLTALVRRSSGKYLKVILYNRKSAGKELPEHIAMYVNDLDGAKHFFDALTVQMERDGYDVISGPRTTGDGYYGSLIVAIEGNLIELTI